MKKVLLMFACITLSALLLCSCGTAKTEVFGSRGTSAYVKIGDYKDIKIDPNSNEYKEYYDTLYITDVSNADLFDRVDEGAVKTGDYANIDFVGTLDGNTFEGGTSNGYDLLIGSGTFIEGFEEGLVGVKVGEKVDLNLKFPQNYDSSELAGKDVVFSVTVNYRRVPKTIDKTYADLGYKSVEEYKEKLNDDCKRFFASKNFVEGCTFKETQKKDEFSGLVMMVFYDSYLRQTSNTDLKSYLSGTNQKLNDFAKSVVEHMADGQLDGLEEIKSVKNTILAYYALFEKEGMETDKKELGKTTGYERCFEEYTQVRKACGDLLYKNASLVDKK